MRKNREDVKKINNFIQNTSCADYCVECGNTLSCAIWDHKRKKFVRECSYCLRKYYFTLEKKKK